MASSVVWCVSCLGFGSAMLLPSPYNQVAANVLERRLKAIERNPTKELAGFIPQSVAIPPSLLKDHGFGNRINDIVLTGMKMGSFKTSKSNASQTMSVTLPKTANASLNVNLQMCTNWLPLFGWYCSDPVKGDYKVDLSLESLGAALDVRLGKAKPKPKTKPKDPCKIKVSSVSLLPRPKDSLILSLFKAATRLVSIFDGDSSKTLLGLAELQKSIWQAVICGELEKAEAKMNKMMAKLAV